MQIELVPLNLAVPFKDTGGAVLIKSEETEHCIRKVTNLAKITQL